MMLQGWRPIGAKKICKTEIVGPQTTEMPAFNVGDRVELTHVNQYWLCNEAIGDHGTIKEIDRKNKFGISCRIKWDSTEHTMWTPDTDYKLLPPESKPEPLMICPKAGECKKEEPTDCCVPHELSGLCKCDNCSEFTDCKCIPYEPEAKVKIRTATHGPASRTTLEVDESIFPLSDIAGINAALKPYGLHIQKTGKRG